MTTMSSVKTQVRTETDARTFVNNQMMSGIISIGMAAGADLEKIINDRKRLTRALSTWLDEQSLSKIKLEIKTSFGTILDTYILDVSYDGEMGFIEFPAREIKREVDRYERDVYIDINPVTYRSRRSRDFGFNFVDAEEERTRQLGRFGAGHLEVDVEKSI